MKKTLIWLLVLILIAGSLWAVFYFRNLSTQNDAPEILRSAQIITADLTKTVAASGKFGYTESVDLYFKTSGIVASIAVENGENVGQGQLLASLNTSDLDRALEQAEISLEQAELNLRSAQVPPDEKTINLAQNAVNSASQALAAAELGKQASLSDASSLIVQAERAREKAYIGLRDASDGQKPEAQKAFDTTVEQEAIAHLNADLIKKQAVSQWWSAYYRYKQAERSLEKLQTPPDEESIKQLELQVKQAKINVEQAQQRIDDATLVAPFEGVITQINLQEGVEPRAAQPAMKLVDKSQYFIEITVDEIEIGKISLGMPATIILDAYPEVQLKGLVDAIAPSAINLGGVVNYNVSILMTEFEDIAFREGMTGSADIIVESIPNVLVIPNWAIRTDQVTGETYCYRIFNGLPTQTPISLGNIGDTTSSIASGLEVGDTVALISEDRNLFNPAFRPGAAGRP